MIYFVTGGCGFIGSNFIGVLLSELMPEDRILIYDKLTYAGHVKNIEEYLADGRVTLIVGDICDKSSLENAMQGSDYVIHFAAESHVDRSIVGGSDFVATNVIGSFNVFESARDLGVKRVVHISTDEVYGSISEGSAPEESRLNPSSPYASSKASSDLIALSFFKTFGLDVVITRCSNNYGPKQFPEKLIPLMIRCVSSGVPVPIYGNGSNVREWLHVQDHCRAILLVLKKGVSGEVYNIGSGVEKSNLEIFAKIKEIVNDEEANFKFVSDRLGHDYRYSVDDKKIKSLGFIPKVNFDLGLANTVIWYKSNLNWWTSN
jgi:dTDP-glucose 4,6-dehydratase